MRSRIEVIRLVWVILTNGFMLYETAPAVFSYRLNPPHFAGWAVEGLLSSVAIILGILFEIRKSRFAKYVNIGFYLYRALWGLVGVVAATTHVSGFTNESWIYFYLVSLPCLTVAAVNYFFYRKASSTTVAPLVSR